MLAGLLQRVNGSAALYGVAALAGNLGARVFVERMTPTQAALLAHPAARHVVAMCMCFAATRNLLLSVALAALAVRALDHASGGVPAPRPPPTLLHAAAVQAARRAAPLVLRPLTS